jgi:predicted amidohydrolase YtcJ
VSAASLDRIKALGGGIAVQNRMAFAGEDFLARYGESAVAATPPSKDILRRGIPVAAGTDGTRVSSYNPWLSLYWLVSGRTVGGTVVSSAANRLSREEALRLWTAGGAWLSGEENVKGRIASGQYADFAVLSDDYFSVPEETIRHIESMLTVVGGTIVYGAGPFAGLAEPLPPVSPAWSPVVWYGGYVRNSP